MARMDNIKRLSEWTYKDFSDYINNRACDGNWSFEMAVYFIAVANDIPNYKFNKKKKLERWWQQNKEIILNLDDNPLVNIDTGEIKE